MTPLSLKYQLFNPIPSDSDPLFDQKNGFCSESEDVEDTVNFAENWKYVGSRFLGKRKGS